MLLLQEVYVKMNAMDSVNVIVTGDYVKMNAMDSVNGIVTGGISKDYRYEFSQCYRDKRYM